MIGRTLAHYVIVEQIGEGGMGTVYRARDTKLGRDVALKVLPSDVSRDPVRLERFRAEARALAALDHPRIVTIYSVEDADGIHFLTMGLVRGRNLGEVGRRGPMALDLLLDVTGQVADALSAAHERGIIHRDLKPANVMLADDGRVTVLDFGLAKFAAAAGGGEAETGFQTRAGIVMGTAPYMSPEQVQGLPVDARTDIYSLGVLIYELASGSRPFGGDTDAAVIAAILRDRPAPLTAFDPRLSPELDRIVTRCLQKDRSARFQSMSEVSDELRRLKEAPGGPPSGGRRSKGAAPKAVVVLPFVNRSGDPENEYFSDGLTEEVIADLSNVATLRTISRNSAMALKGTTMDSRTLARELGVTHLVTGSVRRAGSALRVTAELVEAATDLPVWSGKYSGTLEDVFGIQEEIARQIVSALEVRLTDSEAHRVAERPIDNVVAYEAYLRARREMYGFTSASLARAHRLVDEALAIVGDVPLLLATKGQIFWNGINAQVTSDGDDLERALECAERALAMDPDLPLAISVRGMVSGLRGQVERALPDLYRAHHLAPNDGNILSEVCRYSNVSGLRHHGDLVERAVQLDPLSPIGPLVASTYNWLCGRGELAVQPARRAMELAQTPTLIFVLAAWQIAAGGRRGEAAGILDRVTEAMADSPAAALPAFMRRALAGDEPGALALPHRELEAGIQNEFSAVMMAEGFALIGRRDDAARLLRTAAGHGFINYPYLTEHSVPLAALRADPGFEALLRSVEPRWQAVTEWERTARGPKR